MVSLSELHLRAARARLATVVLTPEVPADLGTVRLRADQRATAGRVIGLLAAHGGCVLADDVGSGKTFVALAVARRWTRVLVVAPAALRSLWHDAVSRAGIACTVVSHERLSLGWKATESFDGVIVDESHRFRSSATKRYATLTELVMSAPLLLLSATPLQNRLRDLAAQIALFHGGRAHQMDARALAEFVVRASECRRDDLPRLVAPRWVRPLADDGAVLDALLALPPPPRPCDGGEAPALRTVGLVRAWASSRAALRATLRQRRRVATAIEQSALEGVIPTRREVRDWQADDGAIQLGLPAVLVASGPDLARAGALLEEAARELRALAALERRMATDLDPDLARVQMLRRIRAEHPGARILVFSERAATVRAFFALLRADAGVGLLTGAGARIASGRVPPDELLARFAPLALGVPPPPARETVTMLLATDMLSEGVNLQDASVVVHLDIPWNPARLAQRVGRVRRPGGAAEVHSLLFLPPARAERMLEVEQRLRRKLAVAFQAIGRGIQVVPGLVPVAADVAGGEAERVGATVAVLQRWRREPDVSPRARPSACLVAGTRSGEPGWLAALDDGRLLVSFGGPATDDARALEAAVVAADGARAQVSDDDVAAALAECARWLDATALARDCGAVGEVDPLDLAIERRLAAVLGRAPRHRRPHLLALAAQLRASLGRPKPLGAERALRGLLEHRARGRDSDADGPWLERTLALVRSITPHHARAAPRSRPAALILLVPDVQRGA